MGPINQYGSMAHYRGETYWPSDYDDDVEGGSPDANRSLFGDEGGRIFDKE